MFHPHDGERKSFAAGARTGIAELRQSI